MGVFWPVSLKYYNCNSCHLLYIRPGDEIMVVLQWDSAPTGSSAFVVVTDAEVGGIFRAHVHGQLCRPEVNGGHTLVVVEVSVAVFFLKRFSY